MTRKYSIAALAFLTVLAGCVIARGEEPGEPVAIRQTLLGIPFTIDKSRPGTTEPAAVQMRVSADRGATWSVASVVPASQKQFVYRAPSDGEYWFYIATVDAQGKPYSNAEPSAGLKVIVDTIQPRLDLTAARAAAGQLEAHWQAVDPNLKIESLKIEYQSGPGEAWESVAVNPSPSADRHSLLGQAVWWPKQNAGPVTVRATVSDRAGNSNVVQTQIKSDLGPSAADKGQQTPALQPQAQGLQPLGGTDWRSTDSAKQGSNPIIPAALDFKMLPPGERPKMVATRTFDLEYELQSVGPSGLAKVDLWMTRDGGRHWAAYGADSDNLSPFPVTVNEEGIYGFRIVVTGNNGLGTPPPRDGDLPELWIGVDLTPPAVRISSADSTSTPGELAIHWEVSDVTLDPRPIALSYSDQPNGPWLPIASGLDNSASYTWRVDSRVPTHVYLRAEARDEAGNVGVFVTAQPILVDQQRPQGRIRNIRTAPQSSRDDKRSKNGFSPYRKWLG